MVASKNNGLIRYILLNNVLVLWRCWSYCFSSCVTGLGVWKQNRRQMHVWLQRMCLAPIKDSITMSWEKYKTASFSSGAWCLNAQAQSNSWLEARSPPRNPETPRLAQHVYASLLTCPCNVRHHPTQLCGLRDSRFILAAHLVQCLESKWSNFYFKSTWMTA